MYDVVVGHEWYFVRVLLAGLDNGFSAVDFTCKQENSLSYMHVAKCFCLLANSFMRLPKCVCPLANSFMRLLKCFYVLANSFIGLPKCVCPLAKGLIRLPKYICPLATGFMEGAIFGRVGCMGHL